MFSKFRKTKKSAFQFEQFERDDSVIVPPKGCLDENLQLPTYLPKNKEPSIRCTTYDKTSVCLNISDVLYTVRDSIFLARRILFEIARLRRSIFAVGPVKLLEEARYVDKELIKLEKCLGTGYFKLHGGDINGQVLLLKGPTIQKALSTAKKSLLDLEKAFDNTVLAELKTGMRWRGRGGADYEKLFEVIKDLTGQVYEIWGGFHTVYYSELEAMKVPKAEEDHVDGS